MKMCINCNRVALDRVKSCPDCGGKKFEGILVVPYNDMEKYLKKGKEKEGK